MDVMSCQVMLMLRPKTPVVAPVLLKRGGEEADPPCFAAPALLVREHDQCSTTVLAVRELERGATHPVCWLSISSAIIQESRLA